jgi:large subunit ribosomal protein L25
MQHSAIQAERREATLSKGQRSLLRKSGRVMASVFGKGMDPFSITIEERDIRRVLSTTTSVNTLIDLTVDGQKYLARIAAVDRDAITREFLNISLQVIGASNSQKVRMPIELTGEIESVNNKTAQLDVGSSDVEIRALSERLVASLSLDVSAMEMGDVLRASDLSLPEGFELISDPNMSLVSLHPVRVRVEAVKDITAPVPAPAA